MASRCVSLRFALSGGARGHLWWGAEGKARDSESSAESNRVMLGTKEDFLVT